MRSAHPRAAAETAIELVSLPQVVETWSSNSALADWAVGGVATHLLGQIFSVTSTLATPTGGAEPVSLMAHYQRSYRRWPATMSSTRHGLGGPSPWRTF